MSENTSIILIIFYIFLVSLGLILFFNITLRYIGKLNTIDICLVIIVVIAAIFYGINIYNYSSYNSTTRNVQRLVDVQYIAEAVANYASDYRYKINELGNVPICPTVTTIGTAATGLDLSAKLEELGLSDIPEDPSSGTATNTGYTLCITTTERIVVNAPYAENGETITYKK